MYLPYNVENSYLYIVSSLHRSSTARNMIDNLPFCVQCCGNCFTMSSSIYNCPNCILALGWGCCWSIYPAVWVILGKELSDLYPVAPTGQLQGDEFVERDKELPHLYPVAPTVQLRGDEVANILYHTVGKAELRATSPVSCRPCSPAPGWGSCWVWGPPVPGPTHTVGLRQGTRVLYNKTLSHWPTVCL
jgi:hypothetical protein